MFYVSWRLWEVHLYVFYVSESLRCQILPALRPRVGPLPKNLRPEASEALRLAEARVLRVLEALGGSSARVLRVREAPGGPGSNHAMIPGGSAKEGPHAYGGRGGGKGSGAAHLYVFYVSWRLCEAHLTVFYVSGRLWEPRL